VLRHFDTPPVIRRCVIQALEQHSCGYLLEMILEWIDSTISLADWSPGSDKIPS